MIEYAPTFTFKCFAIDDRRCAMKVGTDGVLLGAWAEVGAPERVRIADIGSGSGLIALMAAQRNVSAEIDAIEIDSAAFTDLSANVSRSDFADRINVIEGDYRTLEGEYDVILSNPPFFAPGACQAQSSRALARECGELSPQGLLDFAAKRLSKGGSLCMIAPSDLDSDIEYQAAMVRLTPVRRVHVATSKRRGVTRTLWQFQREGVSCPEAKLLVVGSDEYVRLTSPFYLHF